MRDWLKKIRDDAGNAPQIPPQSPRRTRTFYQRSPHRNTETAVESALPLAIDMPLITSEEISGIQWIWYHDFHDAPSVTKIYEEVYGEELVMNKKINERRARSRALLEEICQEQGVPVELVEQLLQIEKDKSGLMRRHNISKIPKRFYFLKHFLFQRIIKNTAILLTNDKFGNFNKRKTQRDWIIAS